MSVVGNVVLCAMWIVVASVIINRLTHKQEMKLRRETREFDARTLAATEKLLAIETELYELELQRAATVKPVGKRRPNE